MWKKEKNIDSKHDNQSFKDDNQWKCVCAKNIAKIANKITKKLCKAQPNYYCKILQKILQTLLLGENQPLGTRVAKCQIFYTDKNLS